MKNKLASLIIVITVVGIAACTRKVESEKSGSPFRPNASLQELMVSVIDPNVDPIWNSVSTISTKDGIEEKQPQSDEEWNVLKNHAIALIEVSNLLVIEGRPVAAPGVSTSTHAVELSPQEVQKAIDANRSDFIKHAHALQDGAKLMLAAINTKNPEELARVGGLVDRACEQCHSQFWYPNDKRPTSSIGL